MAGLGSDDEPINFIANCNQQRLWPLIMEGSGGACVECCLLMRKRSLSILMSLAASLFTKLIVMLTRENCLC